MGSRRPLATPSAGIVPAPRFSRMSYAMTNVVKFPAARQLQFGAWLKRRGYRAASLALSRGSVARAVELVPKPQRTLARALAAEVLAQRQLRHKTVRADQKPRRTRSPPWRPRLYRPGSPPSANEQPLASPTGRRSWVAVNLSIRKTVLLKLWIVEARGAIAKCYDTPALLRGVPR